MDHAYELAVPKTQRNVRQKNRIGLDRKDRGPLKFLYDADEILRKRLFVAKPMTLTRSAKVSDEVDDLDDVIHHLFPHLLIKVDFLKK